MAGYFGSDDRLASFASPQILLNQACDIDLQLRLGPCVLLNLLDDRNLAELA